MISKIKFFLKLNLKECLLFICVFFFLVFVGIFAFFENNKETEEKIIVDEEISLVKNDEITQSENIINTVKVDIKGQVVNPGVYEVESNKRIIDVINCAGGTLESADTSVNNLSRVVKDEMVIIIYSFDEVRNFEKTKEKEQTKLNNINNSNVRNDSIISDSDRVDSFDNTTQKSNSLDNNNQDDGKKNSKISINTGTLEELTTLSGIGESKAQAIIDYRNTKGIFEKIEDILNVSGIGEKLFAKIKDNITL